MLNRPDPNQTAFVYLIPCNDEGDIPDTPEVEYPVAAFTFLENGRVESVILETGQQIDVDTSQSNFPVYYLGVLDALQEISTFSRWTCLSVLEDHADYPLEGYGDGGFSIAQASLETLRSLVCNIHLENFRAVEVAQTDRQRARYVPF